MYILNLNQLLQEKVIDEKNYDFFFKKLLTYPPFYDILIKYSGESIANIAGWSSSVARRAHNPKVVGSNPAPATSKCVV